MKLENNIRKCRFEHGEMTQQALANAIGVTRLTIHSIENSKFVPSTLLAFKIARFFDKSVEDVFYITEEKQGSKKRRKK